MRIEKTGLTGIVFFSVDMHVPLQSYGMDRFLFREHVVALTSSSMLCVVILCIMHEVMHSVPMHKTRESLKVFGQSERLTQ